MADSDLAEPTAKQKKSPPSHQPKGAQKKGAVVVPTETTSVVETPNEEVTLWVSLKRYFEFGDPSDDGKIRIPRPDAQAKARLLYNYCISSNKNVPETVHSLFILGEHYATPDPEDIESPELLNGIPSFFKALSNKEKSTFCYNQVTEALSSVAMPVTVNSLLATRRIDPQDASSSFAGRFVQRVTRYVTVTLAVIAALYVFFLLWNGFAADTWRIQQGHQALEYALWIAFGCVGALVHLLNHALTTTRLQTFEISEERKVWPRLLLGGMFGFVLPWLLSTPGGLIGAENVALGTVAAFFGGYSVRFAIGLLERVLSAFLPETDAKK